MTVKSRVIAGVGALILLAACADGVPTSEGPDHIPVRVETFEVRLPFSGFAVDHQVLGGFASPSDLGLGLVGLDWPEGFEARALLRFGDLPTTASVEVEEGETQVDTALTYLSGRVVLRMDTLAVRGEPPVEISLNSVDQRWDRASTTWEMGVDTLGDAVAWEEPGAGPGTPLGQGVWDPAEGDSLIVALDSATVAEWAVPAGAPRGLRVSTPGSGKRVRVESAVLRVDVQPSLRPDTVIFVSSTHQDLTFIHRPTAPPPGSVLQVGGAPARRSVLELDLPLAVDPPSALCATIPCPLTLTPEVLVFASLILHGHPTDPPGLQPVDTLQLEVRPVLDPSRLPRSPLGSPAQSRAVSLLPSIFAPGETRAVEVPVTLYLRDLLEARREGEEDFPTTLAFLSAVEPTLPGIASFVAPGGQGEPELRLLITVTEGVPLP